MMPGEKPKEPQTNYSFPPTDQKPIMHYDKATNSVWIGFRVDKLDYEGAKTWLDSCKHHVYMMYCSIARQIREQQAVAEQMQKHGGRRSIRDIIMSPFGGGRK